MTYSDDLVTYIKEKEGFLPQAKMDVLAKPPRWMIGYGFTGPDIKPGMCMTEQEATDRLHHELDFYAKCVQTLVPNRVLSQSQWDALIDFAYNVGPGTLAKSDLIKYVNDYEDGKAVNEFLKYCHDGNGEKQPGLVARRAKEALWFGEGRHKLLPPALVKSAAT